MRLAWNSPERTSVVRARRPRLIKGRRDTAPAWRDERPASWHARFVKPRRPALPLPMSALGMASPWTRAVNERRDARSAATRAWSVSPALGPPGIEHGAHRKTASLTLPRSRRSIVRGRRLPTTTRSAPVSAARRQLTLAANLDLGLDGHATQGAERVPRSRSPSRRAAPLGQESCASHAHDQCGRPRALRPGAEPDSKSGESTPTTCRMQASWTTSGRSKPAPSGPPQQDRPAAGPSATPRSATLDTIGD
jgi:hypothetical protein